MRLSPEDAENLRIDRPDLSPIGNIPALPALNRVLDAALTSFPEVKAGESRIRQQEIGMDLAKTVGLPRLSRELELRLRFFRRRAGTGREIPRSKSSPSASRRPASSRSCPVP